MMKYPSDEELIQWILSLEQEELYAPIHLKEEIMKKVLQPAEKSAQKQKNPQISFFAYAVKIVAGMAAAILLTFVLPTGNGMDVSRARERMERIEEQADKREQKLNENYTLPEVYEESDSGWNNNLFRQIEYKTAQLFEKADKVKELSGFWNKNQGGN